MIKSYGFKEIGILELLNYLGQYSTFAKTMMLAGIIITLFTAIYFAPNNNNLKKNIKTPNINYTEINKTTVIYQKEIPVTLNDWNRTDIFTKDSNGNPFDLSIYVLGEDFNWRYESCYQVEKNGKPINFEDYLSYKGVQSRLETSVDIIAVGLSS